MRSRRTAPGRLGWGKVRIEDYPAICDHLLPFRDKLEARATKQEWFELQQAQLAYQPIMVKDKILYPEMSQGPKFNGSSPPLRDQ
jgi:hypothetical protein